MVFVVFQNSELEDKLTAEETVAAELRHKDDELEYELNKSVEKIDKLDRHLAEATQTLRTYMDGNVTVSGGGEGVSKNKVTELIGLNCSIFNV